MIAKGYSMKGIKEANEDSYLLMEASDGKLRTRFCNSDYEDVYDSDWSGPGFMLYAVSDGIGGLKYGADASYMTLNKLQSALPSILDSDDIPRAIRSEVRTISSKIGSNFKDEAGATLVGLLVFGGVTYRFNTGDSICIVWNGDVQDVNVRHNRLNAAMEKGVECPEGEGHYLTDNIGMDDVRVDVDIMGGWDTALICSDGLSSVLGAPELKLLVSNGPECLCKTALERGSGDNITAVTVLRD